MTAHIEDFGITDRGRVGGVLIKESVCEFKLYAGGHSVATGMVATLHLIRR